MKRSKKEPKENYPIGYKLREIEAESKFSQELSLPMIENIVPQATIAAVLAAEGRFTERERKLNLLVTVLLVIMMNLYTTDSIGAVLEKMAPGAEDAMAIVCGPPVMLRFALAALDRLGFARDRIVTTLEMKMRCGVGHCGRCNIGDSYVCKDGPVYRLSRLKKLPWEV